MATDTSDDRSGSRRAQRERERAPRRGDVREAAILDAAATLLDAEGEDAITMTALAKAVGVTRPTLYFYFDSKEAVMTELVARTFADLLTYSDTDIGALRTSEAVLVWFEHLARQWRTHAAMLVYAARNAHRAPEIARLREEALAANSQAAEFLLAREGAPAGADRAAFARAIILGTEASFVDLHSRPHTTADERAVVRALTEMNWGAAERVGASAESRTFERTRHPRKSAEPR